MKFRAFLFLLLLFIVGLFLLNIFHPFGSVGPKSAFWGIDRGLDYFTYKIQLSPERRVKFALSNTKERHDELKIDFNKAFSAYKGTTETLRKSVVALPKLEQEEFIRTSNRLLNLRNDIEESAFYIKKEQNVDLSNIFDMVRRVRSVITVIEDKLTKHPDNLLKDRFRKEARNNILILEKDFLPFIFSNYDFVELYLNSKEAFSNKDYADSRRISEDLLLKLLIFV